MNEEDKNKLNQIFRDYAARRKIYQSEQERIEKEQSDFINAFEQCCQVVIRPVLEEYASFLKEQGHWSYIKQVDVNPTESFHPAIGIDMLPADQIGLTGKKGIFAYPLRFVAKQDKRQVEIQFGCYMNTRDSQDKIPKICGISDINRELVEQALFLAISGVFQVVESNQRKT